MKMKQQMNQATKKRKEAKARKIVDLIILIFVVLSLIGIITAPFSIKISVILFAITVTYITIIYGIILIWETIASLEHYNKRRTL